MKKRQLLLAILLIVTLTLIVSCNNEVISGPGYGSVTISTGNNSKSVQPAADQIAFSYYIIHCSCSTPGINPIEKRFEGSSVKIENMVEGQWTLYVDGFNSSDELIGKSASQNVTIVRDSTTNLHFLLTAIDGQGTLSLSINVQTSKVSTIDCALKIGNENYRTITLSLDDRISNNDGTYTFSKVVNDIDNGFYSSTVTMKDSGENKIGIALTPAIHIYANLESSYEFSWENLKSLLPSVDTPIPSVEPGRCYYNTEVSFSTIEEGTTIYYSFTGSDYQKYTTPLHIVEDSTVHVYSVKQNLNQSEIVDYSYVCKVKTPSISLDSGSYSLSELSNIFIFEDDENATIYYTLDGSDPSVSNTRIQYQSNTSLSFIETTNLRIIAIEEGFLNSEILNISYVAFASNPVPSLQSGCFTEEQELSFVVPEGAQVFYTCDGSTPDENSTLYSTPISITDTCTIKAITVIEGFAPSPVLTLFYDFNCLFSITDNGEIEPINKSLLPSIVVVPERINGVSVTSIGNYAFYNCTGLTSIEIPNSVTTIGRYAFSGWSNNQTISINYGGFSAYYDTWKNCNAEIEVTIPNTTTTIGSSAFYGCTGLTSIEISNSVTSIGSSAFRGCTGLTSIEIPNSVTSIGEAAFKDCTGLTSIEIPNSVTSIGKYAFSGCTGIASITIPLSVVNFDHVFSDLQCYGVFTGYSGTVVFGEGITTIPDYALYYADVSSVTIPSSVTTIEDYVFSGWTDSQTIVINYGGFSTGSYTWKDCNAIVEVTIPNTTTSIGRSAFYGCTGLTSIEIPNSVTSIGGSAFDGCTGLTSIEIPNSVTSIGGSAFYGCTGLTSIEIPNSVTSIDVRAFYGCTGLTSIEIPNSVTSIGKYAFSGCTGLTSIEIPNSVTSIGKYAFSGCTGLTSITIPFVGGSSTNNTFLGYIFGANSSEDNESNVPSSLKKVVVTFSDNIGYRAFYGCTGLTSIEIPNSVTSIGVSAFSGCTGLTSIEIPNSVTSIEGSAFYGCTGLTNIEIPNSVTSIGNNAFSGCTGLTSIEIPNSVTSIGDYAFSGWTNSQTIQINYSGFNSSIIYSHDYYDNDIVTIEGLWNNCNAIVEVTIPITTTRIGNYAFYNCTGLTSIEIPNSVTTIGNSAFEGCTGLTSIEIPNSVTSIGGCVFSGWSNSQSITINYGGFSDSSYGSLWDNCNAVIEVTIPNTTTRIDNYAFYNCTGLTSIEIPNSVTSIGGSVFYGCTGLASIEIPNSVTSIGGSAFYGCTGLTSIEIPNSVTSIGDSVFYGCTGLTSIEIPNSVTSIDVRAFYGCTGLTSIEIPSSVTTIEDYVFSGWTSSQTIVINYSGFSTGSYTWYDCNAIVEVTIPNTTTSIGGSAFYGCTGLTSIEIPSSVTSIGGSAFYGCRGLTSIEIPNSVTRIGGSAFYGCTGLTSIEVPNSVTSIGKAAFKGCTGLINMTIPFVGGSSTNNTFLGYIFGANYPEYNEYNVPPSLKKVVVTSSAIIGDYAFRGCTGLTSLEIPNSVTSIGKAAFYDCSGLTSFTIPNSVTSIDKMAFYGCTGISSITIPSSVIYFGWDYYNHLSGVFSEYNGAVMFEEGTTTIPSYALFKAGVSSVTIPSSVTSIGNDAFYGCTRLTNIEIPSSVTSIGKHTFYGWTNSQTIHINYSGFSANPYHHYDGGVAIEGLWDNCNATVEVTIPITTTIIGDYAFNNCKGLISIEIPNSVTSIGDYAFYGCSNLTSVVFKGTKERWNSILGVDSLPHSMGSIVVFDPDE